MMEFGGVTPCRLTVNNVLEKYVAHIFTSATLTILTAAPLQLRRRSTKLHDVTFKEDFHIHGREHSVLKYKILVHDYTTIWHHVLYTLWKVCRTTKKLSEAAEIQRFTDLWLRGAAMRNTNREEDRSVLVTTDAAENNKYYIFQVCICSLRYPACVAHAPHCHTHYLINGPSFKKILNIKCVLIFSTTLSDIFIILRRIERDMIINVYLSSSARYSCPTFMKLQFSRHIFEKY
jgi:hypothetical protein